MTMKKEQNLIPKEIIKFKRSIKRRKDTMIPQVAFDYYIKRIKEEIFSCD